MSSILVVEDDRNQRLLLQEELEEEGYRIDAVASAEEAIDRVMHQMPDCVVLDVCMPGMDGVELLGKLLSINNHLPVVIHTAFGQYRHNFMTWAADAYVIKHPSLTDLKDALRQVLEKRHAAFGGAAVAPVA
jgi:CheY-like chemotaxis protein